MAQWGNLAGSLYRSIRAVRRSLLDKYGWSAPQARRAVFSFLLLDMLLHLYGRDERLHPAAAYDLLVHSLDSPLPLIGDSLHLISACAPVVEEVLGSSMRDLGADPLLLGWAYQIWNEELRARSTWAVSKRGETIPDDEAIPVATQLFSEEYMTEYLLRCSMTGHRVEQYELFDPACGVGHFLAQAIRMVFRQERSREAVVDFVRHRLFGADIDPDVVDMCRLIVLAEVLKVSPAHARHTWRSIVSHIRCLPAPHGTLDRRSDEALLQRRYRCVVTNPPYLGRRKLSGQMRSFLDREYPGASIDLCAAFMQRCIELTDTGGFLGLVTVDKWLRIKGYESLRTGSGEFRGIYGELTVERIVELGEGSFRSDLALHDGVGIVLLAARKGEAPGDHLVSVMDCARAVGPDAKAALLRHRVVDSDNGGIKATVRTLAQRALSERGSSKFAYLGVPQALQRSMRTVGDSCQVVVGLQTNDDARFVRMYWEVPPDPSRWIIHSKGGGYGRWYGLNRYILDWGAGRAQFEGSPTSGIAAQRWFGEDGWSYTWFANGSLGLRRKECGWSFGRAAASGVFCSDDRAIAFLNSRFGSLCTRRIGGKVQLPEGVVRRIPLPSDLECIDAELVAVAVELKKMIVSGDPTEVSFKPNSIQKPIDRMSLEALLLMVEGELELQVSRAVGASGSERAELDSLLAPPVSWFPVSREGVARIDELWAHLPAHLTWLRERISLSHSLKDRFECGSDELLSLLSAGHYRRGDSKALPCDTKLEFLCRGLNAHPLDLFIALCDRSQRSDAVARALRRPRLLTAILEGVLRCFDHRWWSDESNSAMRVGCGDLSFDSVLAGVDSYLASTECAWGDFGITLMLGKSLREWLLKDFIKWHTDEFFKKPLVQHHRPSRDDRGGFIHTWDSD